MFSYWQEGILFTYLQQARELRKVGLAVEGPAAHVPGLLELPDVQRRLGCTEVRLHRGLRECSWCLETTREDVRTTWLQEARGAVLPLHCRESMLRKRHRLTV